MSIAIILLLWAVLAFTLSITGWLERFSATTLLVPAPAAIVIGIPLLYVLSKPFQDFTRRLSLRTLTRVQLLRLFGFLAFIKVYQHILPAIFAIPTALIDIAIALSSLYVAAHLVSKGGQPLVGFDRWQVLGVLGFAVSIALGVLTSTASLGFVRDGITSQSMSMFPMSLVPSFIGPMVLGAHMLALCASRARRNNP